MGLDAEMAETRTAIEAFAVRDRVINRNFLFERAPGVQFERRPVLAVRGDLGDELLERIEDFAVESCCRRKR